MSELETDEVLDPNFDPATYKPPTPKPPRPMFSSITRKTNIPSEWKLKPDSVMYHWRLHENWYIQSIKPLKLLSVGARNRNGVMLVEVTFGVTLDPKGEKPPPPGSCQFILKWNDQSTEMEVMERVNDKVLSARLTPHVTQMFLAFEMESLDQDKIPPADWPAVRSWSNMSFVLMEYAAHGDLYDVLDDEKNQFAIRSSILHPMWLAWGIMHGLAGLHRKGILHMDMKPQNIFLIEPGLRRVPIHRTVLRTEYERWFRWPFYRFQKHAPYVDENLMILMQPPFEMMWGAGLMIPIVADYDISTARIKSTPEKTKEMFFTTHYRPPEFMMVPASRFTTATVILTDRSDVFTLGLTILEILLAGAGVKCYMNDWSRLYEHQYDRNPPLFMYMTPRVEALWDLHKSGEDNALTNFTFYGEGVRDRAIRITSDYFLMLVTILDGDPPANTNNVSHLVLNDLPTLRDLIDKHPYIDEDRLEDGTRFRRGLGWPYPIVEKRYGPEMVIWLKRLLRWNPTERPSVEEAMKDFPPLVKNIFPRSTHMIHPEVVKSSWDLDKAGYGSDQPKYPEVILGFRSLGEVYARESVPRDPRTGALEELEIVTSLGKSGEEEEWVRSSITGRYHIWDRSEARLRCKKGHVSLSEFGTEKSLCCNL